MSDRVAVMLDGRVLQVAAPRAIYADPDSLAIAEFVGTPRINVLPGRLRAGGGVEIAGLVVPVDAGSGAGGEVRVGVRPEHVTLVSPGAAGALNGHVQFVEHLGPDALVHAVLPAGGATMIARTDPVAAAALEVRRPVGLRINPVGVLLFHADGRRLRTLRPAPRRALVG
jgi:multiple sugar transport system ATP-binding protein